MASVIFSYCLHHVSIDLSFSVEETVCTISAHSMSDLGVCCTSYSSKVAKLASTGSECSYVKQSGAFKVNKRGQPIIVQHLAFTCTFSGLQCNYLSPL